MAIVVHGTFNRLLLPPLAQTALIVAVLPLLMLVVFERSERVTREWVGAGLDLDVELLQLVTSEHFEVTRFASYLRSLRERFPGPIVADMFCLLRLELELSVQAKALVLARGAGLHLPADEDPRDGARGVRLPEALDWPDGPAGVAPGAGDQRPRRLARPPAGAGASRAGETLTRRAVGALDSSRAPSAFSVQRSAFPALRSCVLCSCAPVFLSLGRPYLGASSHSLRQPGGAVTGLQRADASGAPGRRAT